MTSDVWLENSVASSSIVIGTSLMDRDGSSARTARTARCTARGRLGIAESGSSRRCPCLKSYCASLAMCAPGFRALYSPTVVALLYLA